MNHLSLRQEDIAKIVEIL